MNDITFRTLETRDILPTVRLMMKTFMHNEPMTQLIGFSDEEFAYFAKCVATKAAEDQLSIVVEYQNKIIAYSISEDLVTTPPLGFENVSQKFEPIFTLLSEVSRPLSNQSLIKKCEYLHIFMIGCDPDYKMKGLAKEAVFQNIQLAKKKGYKNFFAETTGNHSQRIFTKLGFNTENKILYSDFLFEGKKIFEAIRDHSQCLLQIM